MLHVRVVKTKGGSHCVQVIRYENNKRIIVKHIGTGSVDEQINALSEIARSYIKELSHQLSLFADVQYSDSIVMLNQCEYLGFYYTFLYTDIGYLICSFSQQRYKKDKYEMEKQIEKAKKLLSQPSKTSRIKFLKTQEAKIKLNEELIEKTTKLLGVKGYYTDIEESVADSKTIIERYHDLYKIEQAFRVSKSDLKTRPIFHFKEEPIKLHLLICFMALAVSKHIEIKAATSIRSFLTECRKVTDARMINKISRKEIKMRSEIPPDLRQMISKISRPH